MEESFLQKPELIGREAEMDRLVSALRAALEGNGSMLLVSGEAGVGKTRLADELIREALSLGFRLIRGSCLAESLEPLMPVKTAFREAELLHLVSGEPPPLLVSSYLVDDSGILMAKSESRELDVDPMIFSSMLKAVGDFVKDSMRMMGGGERPGGLNTLGYGDFKIVMEEHRGLHLACVIKGGFSELLVTDMKALLGGIDSSFDNPAANWNGDTDKIQGIEGHVCRLIDSGKYGGKFLVDDPKLKQENLFDTVLLGLQRASHDSPIFLFIDDLQWSDPTTLKLLHYLARNIRGARTLIVGAYRPEDLIQSGSGKAHPLETAMQEMGRDGLFEHVGLGRLDQDSTGRMICSALGNPAIEKEALAKVHEETGGTPFFVMEVLKLLVDEGAAAMMEPGKWELRKELGGLELPSKVYDVVKRRLDRLARSEHQVLECASVIGDEFSVPVLERMAGMDKITLLRILADVGRTHRLIRPSGGDYRFDHACVRDVLYNGIMPGLREEYHRMVAAALSETGEMPPSVNELAHHYHRARDPRAGAYLVKAGNLARERYSNQEAIDAYTNALGYLPEGERLDVTEKIGDLLALVGNYERALEMFEKSLGYARKSEARARLLRKKAEVYMNRGEFDIALSVLSGAGSRAGDTGEGHAKILFTRGCIHQRKGEHDKAITHLQDALSLFERSGDFKGIGDALRVIGTIHWNNGDYEQALAHYGKSLTLMEEMRDEIGTISALGNMGIVYWNQGEIDKALECYQRSLGISEKIGNRAGIGANLANLGLLYWEKGELARSLEFQVRSLRLFETMGDHRGIATVLGNISLLHRDNGDLGLAMENQKLSLGMRERMGDQAGMALALQNMGDFLYDMGDPEGAMDHFRLSLDICTEIGDKRVSVHNLCGMAVVLLFKGDAGSALESAEKALGTSVDIGARSEEVMSRRAIGMVLRAVGQHERARHEFTMAEKLVTEIGDRKEMARLHYESALLCEALGDRDGADRNLREALAEFESMGMRLWAERCRKSLDE